MLGEKKLDVRKQLKNDNTRVASTPEVNSAKPRSDLLSSLCICTIAGKGGGILGVPRGENK